jgi:hypothetical protein
MDSVQVNETNIQYIDNDRLSDMFMEYVDERIDTNENREWFVVSGMDCVDEMNSMDLDGCIISGNVYDALKEIGDVFDSHDKCMYRHLIDMYKPRMRRMTPSELFEMIIGIITLNPTMDIDEYVSVAFGALQFKLVEPQPMGTWDEFITECIVPIARNDDFELNTHPKYCKLMYRWFRSNDGESNDFALAKKVSSFVRGGSVTASRALSDIVSSFIQAYSADMTGSGQPIHLEMYLHTDEVKNVYRKLKIIDPSVDITDALMLKDLEENVGSFESYKHKVGGTAVFAKIFWNKSCINRDRFTEETNFDPSETENTDIFPFDEHNITEFRSMSWKYFKRIFNYME